jgi:hypothetical protein
MQVVRRHQPNEERQIEALLLVLRGGTTEKSEASAPAKDGLTTSQAENEHHTRKPRSGARRTGSTAA